MAVTAARILAKLPMLRSWNVDTKVMFVVILRVTIVKKA
jgi:hypothetical protein